MGEEEWNSKKDQVIVLAEDVHSEKELTELMCKEQSIRDPIDTVQYKFILIPKYKDGKGAVILKSHHCLADGQGFSFLFLAMSDMWDKNVLPALKPMGILKATIVYTLLPFLVLKSGL